MDYARPEIVDALASQYVAGTLRGGARRRFDALLPGHPALRAAAAAWQARLMPLTGVLAPVDPPPAVWAALQQRLFAPLPPAAVPAERWWQRLPAWRAIAGASLTGVVALALVVASPPPAPPPVVVVLQATGAGGAAGGGFGGVIVASVSGDGRALVARPMAPMTMTEGRVLELWSVPPQGSPRSLGVISPDGATVLAPGRLPRALLGGGTAALAVSVEPAGGSPTGAPTGPVVYAGKLQL